jgi:hypothetical protein
MTWAKGSIKIEINNSGEVTKHESKKDETPSAFLARILKTSKGWQGEAVWNYLKDEMEECIWMRKR